MNIGLLSFAVIVYLAIIAYLGYRGYAATKTTADYLISGRSIHPYIMALSYGATFISTSAIVGFGGAAAVFGMGLLWLTFLNIFVGIFIAFVFFGKRTRKMGHNLDAHTFPELLGRRFNSRLIQGASGLLIFLGMPIYTAAVMIGAGQFISQSLGINYDIALFFFAAIVAVYVIMGGLKGVMYTDAFQGSLMFIGMFILLIAVYGKMGGIVNAHQALTNLAPEGIKIFGPKGWLGWTRMPAMGSPMWWELVTTIVMGVGIGVLAQPQLTVRFMTVRSDRELNRAVLVGGIFILMMTGVAFVIGALTNVYFFYNPAFGKISLLAANKNVDNIIPIFINNFMPPWFTVVFMLTLLSAAMSTLSSQFHTMGTAAGRDFYEAGLNQKKINSIYISQAGIFITILLSLFLAIFLPKFLDQGSAIIARGTAIFFGLCAAAFLPMYVGAIYSKTITRIGALAGFWSGLLSSLFWIIFVHAKESAPIGICKILFGVDSLAGTSKWGVVDPIIIALPLSAVATLVFNSFTKPVEDELVRKSFSGIK